MFGYFQSQISQDDGLPPHLCIDCFDRLASFQAFCQQSIESDRFYRKQLASDLVGDILCEKYYAHISHIFPRPFCTLKWNWSTTLPPMSQKNH